jgi:Ni,Fe-hydrogenase maturation factor
MMAPMSQGATTPVREEAAASPRLAILLAMAMFVLVVDTSLMNVSIGAVVRLPDPQASSAAEGMAFG